MVNFLHLELLSDCREQAVTLEEPVTAPQSLLQHTRTFCGRQVPNYPGPSVVTSSSNLMSVHYLNTALTAPQTNGYKVDFLLI